MCACLACACLPSQHLLADHPRLMYGVPIMPVQALAMLEEAEEGARASRHQYLSGVLHNAAKILDANSGVPAAPEQALHALGLAPGEQRTASLLLASP